ncbi:hypothetical protein M440DRAFT_1439803 [Trichoderma longibrachiatum ATCC 18648]|uniref:Uncharacterized protein n=1 Tax=Trichoderma longibrachiatum ATCC 18648 TaxID=983965 RepID=A0A2T4C105_TRILO|nr:hypothetical protein M440DRAFT_1439803 [Trichoderma longibrachiatum ATCC 18648]
MPVNTSMRVRAKDLPVYPIGMPQARASGSAILPIREVAMMLLMEKLTDKPNWHEKVFDEAIVDKWRQEARTQSENGLFARIMQGKQVYSGQIPMPQTRIVSDEAFEFCIAELRNKAAYYVKTGLIPTLDSAGNTIVKSDTFVSDQLWDELKTSFETLRADQAGNVDWHPGTNDMVQNLVHPSMYPFVFGRSGFIFEEEVDRENAFASVGKGSIVPEITRLPDYGSRFLNVAWQPNSIGVVPSEYRSSQYQWLPTNVTFREDGTAKLTSYVNNLYPRKYPAIYEAIEHAIDAAIPAWDQCLRENLGYRENVNAGRKDSRFDLITDASDEDDDLWTTSMVWEMPEDFRYNRFAYVDPDRIKPSIGEQIHPGEWVEGREAILPEPKPFKQIDYTPPQRLREKFKEHGLQVIVKMASIELTPEKPYFPTGSWHVEGQMNERICATALFYLDSENVTDSHLSFRMQTSSWLQDEIRTGQDQYNYLERVYGTPLGYGSACLQNYGDVRTCAGRLLAFPNVFQHRVSSFRLKDATKPGHRRFLALWLVDPHERIVSTANVPPQQMDWWAESLPDMKREDGEKEAVPESLMTVEEAREHRLRLMHERSRYEVEAERTVSSVSYNFCEH